MMPTATRFCAVSFEQQRLIYSFSADKRNLGNPGYKSAGLNNPDMEIAMLGRQKALLGVKAAVQSNLPDFGLAGYYVQQGSPVLPGNSLYVGMSVKWI